MPFLLPHRNLWIAYFTLSQCGRFFSKSHTLSDWLKSNVPLSQPNVTLQIFECAPVTLIFGSNNAPKQLQFSETTWSHKCTIHTILT